MRCTMWESFEDVEVAGRLEPRNHPQPVGEIPDLLRLRRLRHLRQQIEAGQYSLDDKLDAVIDRLAVDLRLI